MILSSSEFVNHPQGGIWQNLRLGDVWNTWRTGECWTTSLLSLSIFTVKRAVEINQSKIEKQSVSQGLLVDYVWHLSELVIKKIWVGLACIFV